MKLKILFCSANPDKNNDLYPDIEYKKIQEAIDAGQHKNSIDLKQNFETTWSGFIKEINEYEPHIIHFTGHGTIDGKLRFINDDPEYDDPKSTEDIISFFGTTQNIKVVFLNACHSHIQAQEVIKSIDIAIGMTDTIKVGSSRSLAAQFYASLSSGQCMESSFIQALSKMSKQKEISQIFSKSPQLSQMTLFDMLDDSGQKTIRQEQMSWVEKFHQCCQGIEVSQLIDVAKNLHISPLYINKIDSEQSLDEAIKELADTLNDDEMQSILDELHNNPPSKKIDPSTHKSKIYVQIHQKDDLKYKAIISTRYSSGKTKKGEFVFADIKDKQQKAFVKHLESYRNSRKKVDLHIIIPQELYLQNLRIWENEGSMLYRLYPSIYLHSESYYHKELDALKDLQEEWDDEFAQDALLSKALLPLHSSDEKLTADDDELGFCLRYSPSKPEEIVKNLEIGKIALYMLEATRWLQDNCEKLTLQELPKQLKKCENLALIWNEPNMLLELKTEYTTRKWGFNLTKIVTLKRSLSRL